MSGTATGGGKRSAPLHVRANSGPLLSGGPGVCWVGQRRRLSTIIYDGSDHRYPLKLPLQIKWRRGPDMPFEMSGYIQSVHIQGTLYVGGGMADDEYVSKIAIVKKI